MSTEKPSSESEQDPKSIGAAARLLAEATSALTKALGEELSEEFKAIGPQVSDSIASSLREVSQGLTVASDRFANPVAGQRSRSKRQLRVEQTRAELLTAAAELIATRGYEGASVGDIAAAAGYTKGAVYANFGSKEELLHSLAREHLAKRDGCPPDGSDLLPGLTEDGVDQEVLARYLSQAQDDPELLLSMELFLYALRHPEDSTDIIEMHRAGLDLLTRQLADVRRRRWGLSAALPAQENAEPAEIEQRDRDTALGYLSITNMVTLEGRLLGRDQVSPEAAARLIARLVEG